VDAFATSTVCYDLDLDPQNLISSSVGASEYSMSILSKSFKACMRYRDNNNNICPDERTNAADRQPSPTQTSSRPPSSDFWYQFTVEGSINAKFCIISPPGIAMPPADLCFAYVTFLKCRLSHWTTGGQITMRIVALTPSMKKITTVKNWVTLVQ